MTTLCINKLDTVLCLGAHADDIEIGCGGTLLRLLAEHPALRVIWVVFSANMIRAEEARHSADHYYLRSRSDSRVEIKSFRESYFPYHGSDIKDFFNELGQQVSPDLVFTHRRDDLHQDHRLLSELTWNTFRNHLIWEYEIPKYDGDLGQPNLFVTLDVKTCERKVESLMEAFPSQHSKAWFSRDTFMGLMRLRGIESNSPTRYAEGFYCRKGMI
jgi:LmbE family N-acetylglucosaminyl deacetylase